MAPPSATGAEGAAEPAAADGARAPSAVMIAVGAGVMILLLGSWSALVALTLLVPVVVYVLVFFVDKKRCVGQIHACYLKNELPQQHPCSPMARLES